MHPSQQCLIKERLYSYCCVLAHRLARFICVYCVIHVLAGLLLSRVTT